MLFLGLVTVAGSGVLGDGGLSLDALRAGRWWAIFTYMAASNANGSLVLASWAIAAASWLEHNDGWRQSFISGLRIYALFLALGLVAALGFLVLDWGRGAVLEGSLGAALGLSSYLAVQEGRRMGGKLFLIFGLAGVALALIFGDLLWRSSAIAVVFGAVLAWFAPRMLYGPDEEGSATSESP